MVETAQSVLEWLQDFYSSQCNGDWEHGFGFKIDTLDNPGWSVDFDLEETALQDQKFEMIRIERTNSDWVHCQVDINTFKGRGGTGNLTELLTIFRDWAVSKL